MNRQFLTLPAATLLLAACGGGGSFNSGGYDPLDAAGGTGSNVGLVDTAFRPGSFVKTSMDNAAFFKNKPEGNATASKMLPANTPMKVISSSGSYVKVELDSGEVGYILSVQVIDQNSSPSNTGDIDDGAYQVWPPVDGGLPIVDPTVPVTDVIPTDIDPDAPEPVIPEIPALPDDAPTPGLGAEPAIPPLPDVPEAPAEEEEKDEEKDEAAE